MPREMADVLARRYLLAPPISRVEALAYMYSVPPLPRRRVRASATSVGWASAPTRT